MTVLRRSARGIPNATPEECGNGFCLPPTGVRLRFPSLKSIVAELAPSCSWVTGIIPTQSD